MTNKCNFSECGEEGKADGPKRARKERRKRKTDWEREEKKERAREEREREKKAGGRQTERERDTERGWFALVSYRSLPANARPWNPA